MLLNYAISAIVSNDLLSLIYPILLLGVGVGALTPWEGRWQLAFNGRCLLTWALASALLAHGSLRITDAWVTVLTALALGQYSGFIRQQFAADNVEGRERLKESQGRLRKILSASPDTVSIIRESDLLVCEVFGNRTSAISARRNMVGKRLPELDLHMGGNRLANFQRAFSEPGEPHDIEIEYKSQDGRRLNSLLSFAPVEIDGEPHFISFERIFQSPSMLNGRPPRARRR